MIRAGQHSSATFAASANSSQVRLPTITWGLRDRFSAGPVAGDQVAVGAVFVDQSSADTLDDQVAEVAFVDDEAAAGAFVDLVAARPP